MIRIVDYIDLCRCDKELRYAFDYPDITTQSLEKDINRRLQEGAERLGKAFPKKDDENE